MLVGSIDIISSNLKFLRLSFKYTQTWVAEQLNVCRTSYILYETGQRMPGADIIVSASNLYGISLTTILTIDCANADYLHYAEFCRDDGDRLLNIYRKLSPFHQGALLERAIALSEQEHCKLHPLSKKK